MSQICWLSRAIGADEEVQYLHQGLALRPFSRRFELADYMTVTKAKLDNGLLVIDLKKEIPEEMKPSRVSIGKEAKGPSSKTIESKAAA